MYAIQRRCATKAESSTGRPWRIAAGAHTYGWKYTLVLRPIGAAPLRRCAPVTHILQYTQYYRVPLDFRPLNPPKCTLHSLQGMKTFHNFLRLRIVYSCTCMSGYLSIASFNSQVSATLPSLPF